MGYKQGGNDQSIEELNVPDTITTFIKDLPNRYKNGEIDKELEQKVDKEWHSFQNSLKQKKGNKVVIFTISVAAALTLFVGTAFVSPAVAQVVAKIPYLNLMINYQPLLTEINGMVREQGYKNQDIVVSVDNTKKEVKVMVLESEEYFNEIKAPLESHIKNILKSRNNDDFKIVMKNDPVIGQRFHQYMEEQGKEVEDATKERDTVRNVLGDVLKQYGYDKDQVIGLGATKGEIELFNIPVTEKRIEEIKTAILDTLKNAQMDYTLKVKLYDPVLVERGDRFMPIYETIANGLTAKTDIYKVDSVGVSNKANDPFYIEVRTTVSNSNKDINKIVDNIAKTIGELLQSSEVQEKIKNEQYKIVIQSKEGKVMREIKN